MINYNYHDFLIIDVSNQFWAVIPGGEKVNVFGISKVFDSGKHLIRLTTLTNLCKSTDN